MIRLKLLEVKNNKMKKILKKLSAVGMLLMVMILLTGIGSAATGISFYTDKKVYEQGDTIKFTVKNTGKGPIYVLDKVLVVNPKEDAKVTKILKISPGKSYTWNFDSKNLLGNYKGLIFWGKDKNKLQSLYSGSFEVKLGKIKFSSDKSAYKYKENIKLTFKNNGAKTVYIPGKKEWQIKDKTGKLIRTLYSNCGSGYGYGCGWTPVYPKGSVTMYWNQKDGNGKQVYAGDYISTAKYKYSGSSTIQTISTNKFMIKKP